MKHIFLCLALIIVLAPAVFARPEVNDPLKIAVGPRYLALGRAAAGLADDVSAIFVNPAGLIQINSLQAIAMRANFLNDYTYSLFGAAMPFPFGAVGIGYVSSFAENIPKTVYVDGQVLPSPDGAMFGGNDDCALISLAVGFKPWFSLGANAKYYKQTVDTNGRSGQAFDIGALIKLSYILSNLRDIRPFDDITLGIVFTNIVRPKLKWSFDSEIQEIPSMLKIGLSTKIQDKFTLTADYNIGGRSTLHAGLEWWISDQVALRIGADEGLSNLTIGIGLKTGGVTEKKLLGGHDFEFDYAYRRCESPLDSDGGHFFGLTYLGPEKIVKKEFVAGTIPIEEKRQIPEPVPVTSSDGFYGTPATSAPALPGRAPVNFYGVDKSMLFSGMGDTAQESVQPVELSIKLSPARVKRSRQLTVAVIVPEGIEINRIKLELKDGGSINLNKTKNPREFSGIFTVPGSWNPGWHEAVLNITASNAFFDPKVIKIDVL